MDKHTLKMLLKSTIFLIIYYIIAVNLYDIIATMTLNRAQSVFYTPIDNMIPFISIFAVFYVFIFYPFILYTLGYFAYIKPEKSDRFFLAIIIMYFISYLTYLIYPVKMNRPDLSNASDFFSKVMNKYYQEDLPVNCFPSLHAANSTLMAYFLSKENRKLSIIFWLIAVLVMISTLFVKQHVIMDEIAGFLVAIFAARVSEILIPIGGEIKSYFKERVIFTVILATIFAIVLVMPYIP